MNKVLASFMSWLEEDTTVIGMIGYVVFAALIVVSVDYAVHNALVNWHLLPKDPLPQAEDSPLKYENFYSLVLLFAWAPVQEEIIFRVLPLFFIIRFVTRSPRWVFAAVTVMAIFFGAVHPYGLDGRVEVAISGFFFGLVFLKCGGLKLQFGRAAISAMAAHGLSNVFTLLNAYWTYLMLTK